MQPRLISGSWLDYYMHYVEDKAPEYPRIYAKWSAITAIAGALKRHVYVIMPNGGWKLYPTTYTVLVGRPGIGKGLAMNDVMPILKDAKVSNILSGKLTMPYVLDLMSKGFPLTTTTAKGTIQFGMDHSSFMYSSELSVFINAYKDTIEVLTDLWDTLDIPFTYGTMTHSKKVIPSPTLSLLGGSAPEWLAKSIPHDAVGGGFTRRVNFIHADKKEPSTSNNGSDLVQKYHNLVTDLQTISTLSGIFQFDPGVITFLKSYIAAAEPDEFDDAATAGYTTTKPAHAVKIAQILSACDGNDLRITMKHLTDAIALVDEAAAGMKKVFRSIGASDYVAACDKILRFLENKMILAQKSPNVIGRATRSELLAFLWKDINSNAELDMILEMLKGAGLITERQSGHYVYYEIKQQPKGVTP